MNESFLKPLLSILGTLLIGFGLGLIVGREIIVNQYQYLIGIVGSLILGGFFLALGRNKKPKNKISKFEEENNTNNYSEEKE
jgi:hypothetical protein